MKISNRIKYEFPFILIGLILVLSGLNNLLNVFPLDHVPPEGARFIFNLKAPDILWSLIALAEIVGGILLIFGATGRLGILLLAPATTFILVIHTLISPAGIWHGYTLYVLVLFLVVFYWRNVAHLLGWRKGMHQVP